MSKGNAVQLAVQLDATDLQIGTEELVDICESVNQRLPCVKGAGFLRSKKTEGL